MRANVLGTPLGDWRVCLIPPVSVRVGVCLAMPEPWRTQGEEFRAVLIYCGRSDKSSAAPGLGLLLGRAELSPACPGSADDWLRERTRARLPGTGSWPPRSLAL